MDLVDIIEQEQQKTTFPTSNLETQFGSTHVSEKAKKNGFKHTKVLLSSVWTEVPDRPLPFVG